MDVCIENIFPAVAMPFNSFHEDAGDERGRDADASRFTAIPNIVHVGIDAFFASVEQVLNPKLFGRPVVVGGDLVVSSSEEASMYGVKPPMTISEVLRICPTAVVLPERYDRYADFAESVRRILQNYTSAVEAGAFNDFYLDFTGTELLYPDYEVVLRRLQREVLERTGLSVTIGAARTKTVASMASQLGKPRGLGMVVPGTEENFLRPLPLEKLHGIAEGHLRRLSETGIATIGELRRVPRAALEAMFGEGFGTLIWERARGLDGAKATTPSTQKSVSREASMEGGAIDAESLDGLIRYLSERIASTLRESVQQARTIGVHIEYVDDFSAHSAARLARPSNDERELLAEAKELFRYLFTRRVALRLLRLDVTNLELCAKQPQQHSFATAQAAS